MKVKNCLRKFHTSLSSRGFSLAELLLGGALTTVVVSTASFGMISMLTNNQTANAKSEVLNGINRATEFISDEIRAAIKIEPNASAALANAKDFKLPSGATPILVLKIPDIPQRIIYYINVSDPDKVWLGPQVIYRWGPDLDENGKYDPDDTSKSDPKQWDYSPLVDSIDGTMSTSVPNCLPGWVSNPPSSVKGFYACVNDKNKLVELHIRAVVSQSSGKTVTQEIQTMTFARANLLPPKFHIAGHQLTLDEPANIKFEVLGGAITCGAGGANIPTTTNLYKDGSTTATSSDTTQSGQRQTWTLPAQSSGTTFTVESVSSSVSCGHYMKVRTDQVNSPQVKVLRNGDSVPNITPFDNQTSIDQFLRDYIQNGKIKLDDNQAIYLFETGAAYDSTKPLNQQASTFDMQDNVVLATIEPTQ